MSSRGRTRQNGEDHGSVIFFAPAREQTAGDDRGDGGNGVPAGPPEVPRWVRALAAGLPTVEEPVPVTAGTPAPAPDDQVKEPEPALR